MNRLALVAICVVSSLGVAEPLTPAAYKKLVLGVADCKVIGYELDGRCPGVIALQDGLKNTSTAFNDIVAMNGPLGRELIKHASPAVRVHAATMLVAVTDSQDAVLAAAAKETDAGALQAFIRAVATSGTKNAKVGAFLLKSASHADAKVREQVVFALGSSWNRVLKGGAEKLLSLAEKDPDQGVRRAACEYGGELGSALFLPVMDKGTSATADPAMYAACMTGLVKMFHSWPHFETSSEGAYKLFLGRIRETPRSAERPPWTVTNAFQHDDDERSEALAGWKKGAPWFKPEEVKKALTALVADKASNAMARKGAVASLLGLGATKAELLQLRAGYDEKLSDDKLVLKALEQAVAKAK